MKSLKEFAHRVVIATNLFFVIFLYHKVLKNGCQNLRVKVEKKLLVTMYKKIKKNANWKRNKKKGVGTTTSKFCVKVFFLIFTYWYICQNGCQNLPVKVEKKCIRTLHNL